jgi:hypothetical protein
MDKPEEDLIKENNRRAANPITQFFMLVETLSIEQSLVS